MIENSIEERFMVESTGVYFEAYNHVLNTIKSTKPSSLPFVKYFAPISDPKALIHALTREIALIEGPPGTGKTVVGVEIMKVLLAKENHNANIGPVLTICFTNHALDQFLEHLLDAKITNIVRLGTRTKSERIEEYTLEEVCKKRSDKHSKEVSRSIAGLHQSLESIEQEIDVVNYNLFKRWMSWQDVQAHLMTNERTFYDKFNHVSNNELPSWVLGANNREEVDFISAQNRWNHLHTFEKWLRCMDYIIIKRRKEALSRSPIKFSYDSTIDYETIRWIIDYEEPETDRPLYMLLYTNSVWQMSRIERRKLHDYWRDKIQEKFIERLSKLKNKHDKKREELNYIYDNERQKTLKDCDVIGMTTNGAAKFQNLIRSIGPKIIVCEEAGEVLEAHILSALSPATQHIILIGDPNQLRPRIATYSLSLESKEGKNYQLDKSLFERLVNGDKAAKIDKVQLLTQRRMRKHEISDLIRYTIYPELIDGENTANYSNIRGSQQNVFFIDHRYPEDDTGGDFATQSHVNKYEVKMVVEMVKHFVRNGYTKPEDIAVITPYLGQMMKIKEALDDSFVVVIDERDAQSLAEMEQDDGKVDKNEKVALEKSLHQQVTLRTVDNFQGEEANIVIISLVRNFAGFGKRDTIGFLKSTNRSNVLLSRAREGMYLIGNSKLMAAKSKNMWTPEYKANKSVMILQINTENKLIINAYLHNFKN
ncbi:16377_t:CDS:2 [Funneliformis geosporum]|nr:16377_t:CDS:2 [Funneliformis geosporum]